METLKEMKERHQKEFMKLQESCPHNVVEILDGHGLNNFSRSITIRCVLCGTPIIGWEGKTGYGEGKVLYAKGYQRIGE